MSPTKVALIVQARMASTRLPGKILKEVLGKPLLSYLIERLRRVRLAETLVLATTTHSREQPIVDLCEKEKVSCFRGSEEDVLARYEEAAKFCGASSVVRITSDCPLIDPELIDQVIDYYQSHPVDYVSNTLVPSYPRGMDVEVFSFKALQEAAHEATSLYDREHVTPFIYHHPDRFRLANVSYPQNESSHRWTLDTIEDFELIEKLIENLYPTHPEFTLSDLLKLSARHPEWSLINAHIKQKNV